MGNHHFFHGKSQFLLGNHHFSMENHHFLWVISIFSIVNSSISMGQAPIFSSAPWASSGMFQHAPASSNLSGELGKQQWFALHFLVKQATQLQRCIIISHMLHVWYIYLHDWVILFGQMLVNIPAPWFAYGYLSTIIYSTISKFKINII